MNRWLRYSIYAALCVLFLSPTDKHIFKSDFDLHRFAKLPVLQGGRIKPMDSIARNTLLNIQGRQRLKIDGQTAAPIEWLLLVATRPKVADALPIFVVENPQIFAFKGEAYTKQKFRVPFSFLAEQSQLIFALADEAEKVDAQLRSPLQRTAVSLRQRMFTYSQLKHSFYFSGVSERKKEIDEYLSILPSGLKALEKENNRNSDLIKLNDYFKSFRFQSGMAYMFVVPPFEGLSNTTEWLPVGQVLLQMMDQKTPLNPAVQAYATILDAYTSKNASAFNSAVENYEELVSSQFKKPARSASMENWFNQRQLFYKSILIYGIAILFVILSLVIKSKELSGAAFYVAGFGFLVHSSSLMLRMIIQGRPPVTNLYSSAIFVGWIVVLIGLVLERIFRNRIGIFTASVVGILTLIVAHHLSLQGDTLEMMQAVLDSNFWLATHVVTITIGYGAVFMAGALAAYYILGAFLTGLVKAPIRKSIAQMVYAMLAVALLFSVIGTILGGIWADQSWGRFWGWDPKENGAILICIWLAIILHARIAGLIKERGLMVLSVAGNMVCAFSWFGVNMLGIGLHSYGFMEKAAFWLVAFWASQVVIMIVGMLPLKLWNSFKGH